MTITVIGLPGPQGSKRFVGHAKSGRGIMVESSAKVRPWREAVKWTAMTAREDAGLYPGSARGPWLTGPLSVDMTFTLPRPKSAPKRRTLPDRKPDLSKLVRSTEDALTDAGTWEDDARVVRCFSQKLYVGDPCALDVPGCVIKIEVAA